MIAALGADIDRLYTIVFALGALIVVIVVFFQDGLMGYLQEWK